MKTYVKSIRYTRTHDKERKEDDHSPCVDCAEKCKGVTCKKLRDWLNGVDEASVEWEVYHDCMISVRMVCRTVLWLSFFGLLWYLASEFVN